MFYVQTLVLRLQRVAVRLVFGGLGLTRLFARCLHREDAFAILAAHLIANVSTTDVQRRVAAWAYRVDAFNVLIRLIRQRGNMRCRLLGCGFECFTADKGVVALRATYVLPQLVYVHAQDGRTVGANGDELRRRVIHGIGSTLD